MGRQDVKEIFALLALGWQKHKETNSLFFKSQHIVTIGKYTGGPQFIQRWSALSFSISFPWWEGKQHGKKGREGLRHPAQPSRNLCYSDFVGIFPGSSDKRSSNTRKFFRHCLSWTRLTIRRKMHLLRKYCRREGDCGCQDPGLLPKLLYSTQRTRCQHGSHFSWILKQFESRNHNYLITQ